jgi:hypothetical protein
MKYCFLVRPVRHDVANFSSGSAYPGEPERIRQRSWICVRSAFRRYYPILTYGRSGSPPSRLENAGRRKAERPLPQSMCNIRRLQVLKNDFASERLG